MTTETEVSGIAGKLTKEERACLLDLPANEPWLMGNRSWRGQVYSGLVL